jgi:hypothetical protein
LYPEKAKELLELFNEMDSKMPDAGLGRVPFNRKARIE